MSSNGGENGHSVNSDSSDVTKLNRRASVTLTKTQILETRNFKINVNETQIKDQEQEIIERDEIRGNNELEPEWEFAGWGTVTRLNVRPNKSVPRESKIGVRDRAIDSDEEKSAGQFKEDAETSILIEKDKPVHQHPKLGQWRATAIAGNDITSSCLYVAGIAAQSSRKFTPISLMIVVVVLYFFRNIYSEVGQALPLNGGSYNVLLNSTTKFMAAFAACLSIISYVATAVVSAASAVSYLGNLYEPLGGEWMVIVVLGIFAFLNLIGISESANVAVGIFFMHLTTLVLLVIVSSIKVFGDFSVLVDNWHTPSHIDPISDIYFGFAAALLGVTGFETSSNYIEEQAEGVFPKTLRNMWVLVAIFNPLLSFLSLGILPMNEILQNQASLLAWMAKRAGGDWLNYVVCIDATLVLSGAVLTAYVGVTGLVRRMSLDRCMPEFLMHQNKLRGTNHWIIIGFFGITSSLYLIVNGDIDTLGGVYTIAFLGVMALFAVGNMLLKYKRARLKRKSSANWFTVIFGFCAIVAGLIGNIVYNLEYLFYFSMYFSVTMAIVLLMFARIKVLKFLLFFCSKTFLGRYVGPWIREQVRLINNQATLFFAKTDRLDIMGKACQYVRDNELCSWLRIVHVYQNEEDIPKDLELHVHVLDKMYPKMRIDLVLVKGEFGPEVTNAVSEILDVPKNYMFITCPGHRFPHNISDFGGIRLITH